MISIKKALQIIKQNIPSPQVIKVPIKEAISNYLTKDICSPEPSPRYTNSAMDGYAVRWQDVSTATEKEPATLKIVGESRAGTPFTGQINNGEAIRISTGAMLANDCDTVIPIEETRESGNNVKILSVSKQGRHVRYKGEEFKTNTNILQKNSRISAPQVGLLASVGIETVPIYKPCQVAVLVTGSELVSSGSAIADHQIRDSNMIMLQAAVSEAGGQVVHNARISDSIQETIDVIDQTKADIILCSGGVSVGRHDHVKEASEKTGFTELFWKISQKPGKPLYFARKDSTLLFGLPGNPVSAFMCFAHYVRPIIGSFSGLPFGWPTVSGQASENITNKGTRTNMIRVQMTWRPHGGYCITNSVKQGSHMLTSLADADGYIILEPKQTVNAGDRIDVYRYDFRREPV